MKKFCIIAVDYEHHVPRGEQKPSIQTGLQTLADQTFKDFNIIICHDGRKDRTYEEEGIDFKKLGIEPIIANTHPRMNDWGHSSRDLAMKLAYEKNLGEYFIQFNIDNFFNNDALEILNNTINSSDKKVFIFPVFHHKYKGGVVLSGIPPVLYNIDAMQLVAHRDIWKANNFWYNKRDISDGILYEDICKKNEYEHIPITLGENF
jgi:hypothetical protein